MFLLGGGSWGINITELCIKGLGLVHLVTFALIIEAGYDYSLLLDLEDFLANFNMPFLSCLLPMYQNECTFETTYVKIRSAYRFIFMQIKLMFCMKTHCAVPENIHTPPQKGLQFPGGYGLYDTKKINLTGISRGVGVWQKSLPWGRYGYSKNPHIRTHDFGGPADWVLI